MFTTELDTGGDKKTWKMISTLKLPLRRTQSMHISTLTMLLLIAVTFTNRKTSGTVLASETAEPNSLTFLLLGDWGKGGTTGTYSSSLSNDEANTQFIPQEDDDSRSHRRNLRVEEHVAGGSLYQVQIAAAMGTRAASMIPPPSFIVTLGDNFYSNGVSSSTDSLWNKLWKNVYLGYENLNIPWFPVLGNRKILSTVTSFSELLLKHLFSQQMITEVAQRELELKFKDTTIKQMMTFGSSRQQTTLVYLIFPSLQMQLLR